jgi:hypothetical protein
MLIYILVTQNSPSTQSFGFMQTAPYQLADNSCASSPYFSPKMLEANPFVQVVQQPMQKQVFPDTSSKPLAARLQKRTGSTSSITLHFWQQHYVTIELNLAVHH